MADDEKVTLGEIHRILLEVRNEVRRTNGRVDRHDVDIAVLQTRLEDGRVQGRNWGAGAGAIGGLLGGFIAGFLGAGK